MPQRYTVTAPDGRKVTLTGDSEPTEADLDEVFSAIGATAPRRPVSAEDFMPAKSRGWPAKIGDVLTDLLPTAGGTVGSIVGGPLGAAAGGAAGEGFRTLLHKAGEIPAAVSDVARNVVEQPAATARGFMSGAVSGAEDAGVQGAVQGVATAVGNAIPAVARSVAPALMQSALKPGIKSTLASVKSGNVPQVVKTLLDEGVNVTPGGIEKLNTIIGTSNATIKDALDNLSTRTIDPRDVVTRLFDPLKKFSAQVNPEADLAAIKGAGREFLSTQGPSLTLPEAQALKTGTYAALKDKAYGELKGASIEAQKSLARGLKEEIAAEAQKAGIDLTSVNAREGAAITARDAIAKRVAQVGNRDPAGLAWLAHSPVTFLMAISERSPVVKSMIARGLWQSAAKVSGMPIEALKSAAAAIASHAVEQEQDQ